MVCSVVLEAASIGAVRLTLPLPPIRTAGTSTAPLVEAAATEPSEPLFAALRIDRLISEAELMQIFNATKTKYGL
jgi:hypothetical protein